MVTWRANLSLPLRQRLVARNELLTASLFVGSCGVLVDGGTDHFQYFGLAVGQRGHGSPLVSTVDKYRYWKFIQPSGVSCKYHRKIVRMQ